ncbi:hypothetical protein Vadar_033147 [Vaccinium darrowii]|uniref:Uncharacterized protein n=1 Tax=Vaccinium darrowii TaxID=229202 RepID=A0ACB7Z8Q5_9ERIC|nr:hypothetical protein Vadar_033147 [Vaccinium darrowii]
MEWASKVMNAATRASNNNTVINVFLVGAFVALSVRSVKQQRDIEALESQKDRLLITNKAMKKSMWDWKQQLFAEASSPDTAIVPLSKLKAIYGESPITLHSTVPAAQGDGKSAVSKIVI